jgi:hypothetical protein
MMTLVFDRAAIEFGQGSHPERPARLTGTEAYLLDKRSAWICM